MGRCGARVQIQKLHTSLLLTTMLLLLECLSGLKIAQVQMSVQYL